MKTKYRKNKNKNKSRKIVKGGWFCKSITNLFKRKQSVKVDLSDKVIKQINEHVKKHVAKVKRNATAKHLLNSKDKFDPETYSIKQKKLISDTALESEWLETNTVNIKEWLETNKAEIKGSEKLFTQLMEFLKEDHTIENAEFTYGIKSLTELNEWYKNIKKIVVFYIKSLCVQNHKHTDDINECISQTEQFIMPPISEYYYEMKFKFI